MALVADRERFGIVAAAALDVEAKTAWAVAALARFREHGEEVADGREYAGVSSGIRARSAADGGLVDLDDFVDLIGAQDFAMRGGRFRRAVKLLRQRAVENVIDERGFPGTGDARDNDEHAKRQIDVDFLEIVRAGAKDLNDFSVGAAALFGNGNLGGAAEILAGERFGGGFDLLRLAVGDEIAAGVARARAEVHNEIGAADGFFIVLDDQDGVAEIAEVFERAQEARVVAGVKTDAGLVEDIKNAAKTRADLRG